jgi:hypothetical protein
MSTRRNFLTGALAAAGLTAAREAFPQITVLENTQRNDTRAKDVAKADAQDLVLDGPVYRVAGTHFATTPCCTDYGVLFGRMDNSNLLVMVKLRGGLFRMEFDGTNIRGGFKDGPVDPKNVKPGKNMLMEGGYDDIAVSADERFLFWRERPREKQTTDSGLRYLDTFEEGRVRAIFMKSGYHSFISPAIFHGNSILVGRQDTKTGTSDLCVVDSKSGIYPIDVVFPNLGIERISHLDVINAPEGGDARALVGTVKKRAVLDRNDYTGRDMGIVYRASEKGEFVLKPVAFPDENDEMVSMFSPVWSRASSPSHRQKMALMREHRDGYLTQDICIANEDGTGLNRLTTPGMGVYSNPAWGKNGVIYCLGGPERQDEITMLALKPGKKIHANGF